MVEQHGFIFWIIIGGIAGWIASLIAKGGGSGIILDIILGVIGAVLFGWIWEDLLHFSSGHGLFGSLIGAIIGALVLLFGYRFIRRMTNNT